MGISSAEHTVRVAASPEACFDAGVDYESFPDWQQAVISVEVMERDGDGLGSLVRFEVDAKLRRISYTLRYHYERPARVWWDFIEGEGVSAIEGEYLFEDVGGDTEATYRLGIDSGVPMPGLIARRLSHGVMRRSLDDLRREVERRARD